MGALGRLWHRRYGGVRFRLMDVLALGYIAGFAALLPAFADPGSGWEFHFLLHLLVFAVSLEAIRASELHPASRLLAIPRLLYPGFVITYGFIEAAKFQTIFAGEPWATDYLIAWDLAIFGVHPTVWIKQLYHPVLTELMCFFRVLYYFTPFLVMVPLLLRGRRDDVFACGAVVILVYAVNYFLFMLMPGVNPRQVEAIAYLDTTEFTGYWLASIEHAIQGDQGTVAGASFPSAHVSAELAWTLVAYRYLKGRELWIAHFLAFVTAGTAISTVYLGFHHAVDPIAGFVLGLVCYPIALRLLQRRGEDSRALEPGAAPPPEAESLASTGSP